MTKEERDAYTAHHNRSFSKEIKDKWSTEKSTKKMRDIVVKAVKDLAPKYNYDWAYDNNPSYYVFKLYSPSRGMDKGLNLIIMIDSSRYGGGESFEWTIVQPHMDNHTLSQHIIPPRYFSEAAIKRAITDFFTYYKFEDDFEEYTLDESLNEVAGNYEVKYDYYNRYGGDIRTITFTADSDLKALLTVLDKCNLYLERDSIYMDDEEKQAARDNGEEEEAIEYFSYDNPDIVNNIINAIEEQNGDGCDFIFYIKRPDGSLLFDSGEETDEPWYDGEDSSDENYLDDISDEGLYSYDDAVKYIESKGLSCDAAKYDYAEYINDALDDDYDDEVDGEYYYYGETLNDIVKRGFLVKYTEDLYKLAEKNPYAEMFDNFKSFCDYVKENYNITEADDINYLWDFICDSIGDFRNKSKNESLKEGCWSCPNTVTKARELVKLLSQPLPAGKAKDKLYNLIGDDALFDDIDDREYTEGPDYDVSYLVKAWILGNIIKKDAVEWFVPFDDEVIDIFKRMLKKDPKFKGALNEALSDKDINRIKYMVNTEIQYYQFDDEDYLKKTSTDDAWFDYIENNDTVAEFDDEELEVAKNYFISRIEELKNDIKLKKNKSKEDKEAKRNFLKNTFWPPYK